MLALFTLPSPLHPALVHFPIVLLLLGAGVAVGAAFAPRWHLPIIAAALLVLGSLGAVLAAQTGEDEGEMVEETVGVESVLDQHEEWAERTEIAATIAALLALSAVGTRRWPRVARGLGVTTALAGLVAAGCVATTGHFGGQLVYRYGAGVNLAPPLDGANPDALNPAPASNRKSVKSRKSAGDGD